VLLYFIIGAVCLILLAVLIFISVDVVPSAQIYIIERQGNFHAAWKSGVHFKIPFIDRIIKKISLKERVINFDPHPVITKDNVTIIIESVVYFKISNAEKYAYGIDKPSAAVENMTIVALRDVIGSLIFEEVLTPRDDIAVIAKKTVQEACENWGIEIVRIEVKNITPPADVQASMEKQMKAERERRARILEAEGEKASQVLIAQGHKEAEILRASAAKEAKILESEGEAESIFNTQRAIAESLEYLNSHAPNEKVLALKSLEAFVKAADGKANKIIVPSNIPFTEKYIHFLKYINEGL